MTGFKKTNITWLLSLAVTAAALLTPAQGVAHQAVREAPLAEVEQKNEKLVRDFMAAFSELDMEKNRQLPGRRFYLSKCHERQERIRQKNLYRLSGGVWLVMQPC